jgi:L-amino acid N-acyltransferase YncA
MMRLTSTLPVPTVGLRDGRVLPVRRLVPEDRAELAAAILRLSPQSRYLRFFAPRQKFSNGELTALTTLDGRHRDAIVALDPAGGHIVAVARYAELPSDPVTADVAITVCDELQGRGLGGALLDVVIGLATAAGFTRLHADVLAENRVAQALLRSRGFRSVTASWGVRELERPLAAPAVGTIPQAA